MATGARGAPGASGVRAFKSDRGSADQSDMWFVWVLVVWSLLALGAGLLTGRFLHGAAALSEVSGSTGPLPVAGRRDSATRTPAVPAFSVVLAVIGVALESAGLVVRTTGLEHGWTRAFAMDLPLALPRMFVAGVFAAAAVAAVLGAVRLPRRRTWWLAVAAVAGCIAAVKAGGTVHTQLLQALGASQRPTMAVMLSSSLAALVIAALWWLSRDERRDRRRVLGGLGWYAVAAVGLSALSSAVPSAWGAAATYTEETGEALAAVAFLVAVIAGALPHLVRAGAPALRRADDRLTIQVDVQFPAGGTTVH